MPLANPPGPQVVAVQIKIIRRDGDLETTQALDIPVRNPQNFDMTLDTNMYNVHMDLDIRVDPRYSIQYVIRDQNAKEHAEAGFSPYRDGIYSEQDVAGIKAGLEFRHAAEMRVLKKEIKKLLKTVRTPKS